MPVILSYDVANTTSWPGSGTTLYDLSGLNNHGTLQNGSILGTGYGGYISFNGINQEITTTNSITNPQNFSMGVWFRIPSGYSQGKKLIGFESSQTGTGSSSWDRQVWIGTDGKLYFGVSSGSQYAISSSGTYNDNIWHYVVATYTANSMKLYIDGSLIITGNSPASAVNYNGYWRIGGYKNGWTNSSDGYYYGLISKVQVWNEVIDATQVSSDYLALFSSRFNGTTYPPAFYHNLYETGAETMITQQTIEQKLFEISSESMYIGNNLDQRLFELQSEAMYKGENLSHQLRELSSETMYIGNNLNQQLRELKAEVLYVLPPKRKKQVIIGKGYNIE